jgi:hypothetical protein
MRITNGKNSNWEIHLNDTGYMESKAIVAGCGDSVYGSVSYFIKRVKNGGFAKDEFTKEGLEFLEKNGFKW